MIANNELIKEFFKKIESPFDKKLGVKLIDAQESRVVIELGVNQDLTNSSGIVHGGVTASLCDTAMGASIMTLGVDPVTVEMKLNYLYPGGTDSKLIAIGKVVKQGRTLIIAEGDVYCKDKLIARSLGTYFAQNSTGNVV